MLVMETEVDELVLVTVTFFEALAVPASWLPKSKLVGERAIRYVAEPVPLPDKATGCVPGKASVVTERPPETEPLTVG